MMAQLIEQGHSLWQKSFKVRSRWRVADVSRYRESEADLASRGAGNWDHRDFGDRPLAAPAAGNCRPSSGELGLVGRWVAWIPRGVFVHRPITATAKVRGEVAIGWAFHYVVGIASQPSISRS
jgi:hypothetical protein